MDQHAPFPHYVEWLALIGEAFDIVSPAYRKRMVAAWRLGYKEGADPRLLHEQDAAPPGGDLNFTAPLARLYRHGFRQRRMELASPYWRQPPAG